jgi:hypothetical protein
VARYGWHQAGLGELFVRLTDAGIREINTQAGLVVLAAPNVVRDDQEGDWNTMLRAMNVMQFLPGFAALADGQVWEEAPSPPPPADDPAWLEAFGLVSGEARALLEQVRLADLPVPKVGEDVADPRGEVLGTAELAWPQVKVALLLEDEWAEAARWHAAGWHCWSIQALVDGEVSLEEVTAYVCQTA